jgi:Asp-tRNA(Asn)/Glu-tRNA(Gln) amidotransferase A subunit family amidase
MSTSVGENLSALSIRRTLDAYRAGSLSPVDVAQSCIEAVAHLDQRLHAWACFEPERALAQARAAAQRIATSGIRGRLEGVPVGVKDIFNTADFPTEMGSRLWKGYSPGNDARAVFSLRQAGAIIPGKTATAEFAVHALGDTVNPHDAARTPGTSSSGSAVAVAVGIVPVALGTQTGGSIVRPASYCGVYGFKPSFGLIPRTGMLKTTDSLDTVGFLARHLEDLEPMLDVLRVHGRNYPISDAALRDEARQSAPRGRPWKIAMTRTHTWEVAQPYAKDALVEWCLRLASLPQVEVEDVTLPSQLERAHEVHTTIYDKTLAYYFAEEFKQPDLMSRVMREVVVRGSAIDKGRYLDALASQSEMASAMDRLLGE